MTHLADLFGADELEHALNERLIVARKHPLCALTILNYTDRVQYEPGLWSAVTRQCRGLIHDDNGVVVARPFRKFFNYGQAEAPEFALDAAVSVTDKMDGSLGILYRASNGFAISTRGSFESEQAIHATFLFHAKYKAFVPPKGWTLLFEIVFPANRVVLDYGDMDDLVLLGAVEIATGKSVGPDDLLLLEWDGPRAEVFEYATLAQALAALPRAGAEGLVVHFLDADERVKLKQDDYVALHKIICGLNERVVWQHLMDGKPLVELLAGLPDEFHEWVGGVAARLLATVEGNAAEVEDAYSTILTNLVRALREPLDIPDGVPRFARKEFALLAVNHPLKSLLFMRYDGKDYRPALWKELRPSGRSGPRGLVHSEETA